MCCHVEQVIGTFILKEEPHSWLVVVTVTLAYAAFQTYHLHKKQRMPKRI